MSVLTKIRLGMLLLSVHALESWESARFQNSQPTVARLQRFHVLLQEKIGPPANVAARSALETEIRKLYVDLDEWALSFSREVSDAAANNEQVPAALRKTVGKFLPTLYALSFQLEQLRTQLYAGKSEAGTKADVAEVQSAILVLQDNFAQDMMSLPVWEMTKDTL